ncbi:FeoA family protein [Carnobacterium gallinarum]|uniref:FeoA family protein n=1 Tax=Carnobacterium gallinarum TaxID=2749 RepID=UPI00068C57BA|nr:FeoA family protein [Carnobacterium gallinarum]
MVTEKMIGGLPLAFFEIDRQAVILKIKGVGEIKQRLASIGIAENEEIIIVAKNAQSCIVKVKESKVALDFKMTNKIIVKEKTEWTN